MVNCEESSHDPGKLAADFLHYHKRASYYLPSVNGHAKLGARILVDFKESSHDSGRPTADFQRRSSTMALRLLSRIPLQAANLRTQQYVYGGRKSGQCQQEEPGTATTSELIQ